MTRISWSIVGALVVAAWVGWPRTVLTHGSITTTVLFDREIVRVLNTHCVSCHSEGGLSFPLSTYEQTWVQRLPIRTEVLRRHMPPWAAVAGYGEFVNDNGLTIRETQFVVSWVEGLGPRNAGTVFLNIPGSAPAPPAVRATAHVGHWQLGEPDLMRRLDPIRIAAGEGDVTRRVVIDLGLQSSRLVRALEYMPGDRRAVRAAVFTVQGTGQWLGSWTPWYGFAKLPDGVAHRLPVGTRVVAEIHYRGRHEAFEDRGTLGLFFAERSASVSPADLILDAKTAPTGVTRGGPEQTLRASMRLPAATSIWAIKPDLVPGLASLELSARRPDGSTEVLFFATDPPVAWPTPYILKTPARLPRGTELRLVARRSPALAASGSVRLTVGRY